jgi:hypothetical protein
MFAEFYKQKTGLTENDSFRSFAANGKQKQQTSVRLLEMETENKSLFSMVGEQKSVIDDCCFSKRAYLW